MQGCTLGTCFMPDNSALPKSLNCKYVGVCVLHNKDKEPLCGEEAQGFNVSFQCRQGYDTHWEITSGAEHLSGF